MRTPLTRLEQETATSGMALRQDGPEWVKVFLFRPEFVGFSGHFPERPILPALVQLMAGALCAQEAAGLELAACGVSRAKFLKPVSPDQEVLVRATLSHEQNTWRAKVRLESQGETVSTFQLTLAVKEP